MGPHGTNLNELRHMTEHGFTPQQALVAATSSAAELMGIQDELGTLAPGKRADVVVVDGDPFAFATFRSASSRSGRTAPGRAVRLTRRSSEGKRPKPRKPRPILAG